MPYAIDSKENVTLGGVQQSIRIRTTDPGLPVLLFLHGGPGVCDRHWVLKHQSHLADIVTMVCWDQRGAGHSYRKGAPLADLSVARLVDDAGELCVLLKERLHKDKIVVVGHSWGSLLAVLLIQKYPQHVAAYLGMRQFVDGPENERISYDFCLSEARRLGDAKAVADLERIGCPVDGMFRSQKDMMVQRNLLACYGGAIYQFHKPLITGILLEILASPEYRLWHFPAYSNGSYSSLDRLWREVVSAHLIETAKSLPVPVFLLEGRHDWNTPVALAQTWYDQLQAPKKEWFWFEESAHSPIKEEPEKWGTCVRGILNGLIADGTAQ